MSALSEYVNLFKVGKRRRETETGVALRSLTYLVICEGSPFEFSSSIVYMRCPQSL